MGLDMYAFATDFTPPQPVDFRVIEDAAVEEIFYWRKHPNLHGWMEQLYRSKGGGSDAFNGDKVVLTLDDLNALEAAVSGEQLPHTVGFFFGESTPEDKADDLAFIEKARKAINEGKTVFYDSWW